MLWDVGSCCSHILSGPLRGWFINFPNPLVGLLEGKKMKSSLNIKNNDFWARRHRLHTLSHKCLCKGDATCSEHASCVNEPQNTFWGGLWLPRAAEGWERLNKIYTGGRNGREIKTPFLTMLSRAAALRQPRGFYRLFRCWIIGRSRKPSKGKQSQYCNQHMPPPKWLTHVMEDSYLLSRMWLCKVASKLSALALLLFNVTTGNTVTTLLKINTI